jgi:hypothetical protein
MKDTLKSRVKNSTTPMGFELGERVYGTRSSYATIVYFHYKKQNFGIPSNVGPVFPDSTITAVTRGVIEDDIQKLQISKSIESSSGTFNVTLLPSKNWKQFISPGDWVMIFLDDVQKDASKYYKENVDTKNLVLVGSIDRVSRSVSKNEDTDRVELRYNISGRNFGKVFEETDIWFDPYQLQNETLNRVILPNAGLELVGNPSKMCKQLINVFLGKGEQFSTGRTKDLGNWVIPKSLALMLGSKNTDKAKFFDVLNVKIEDNLPGFKQRQMITLNSNGGLHSMLKRCSNDLVNEIYYEEHRTKDGVKPTVFLKPRPINTPFFESHCGSDASAKAALKKLNGKVKTLQKLADESFIEISPSEIIYENIGKDDHSRFNMFWLRPVNNLEHHFAYAADVNSQKSINNPTINIPSIERYGLKRFDQVLEFCHTTDKGGTASPEIELWKAFMVQVYDMHYANHLYEAGTIECTGVLEAELGKALIVKSQQAEVPDKVYFIEGYEHKWSFPNKWTTMFTVTHGQFKQANSSNIFIDVGVDWNVGPTDFGLADKDVDLSFVAKTVYKKDRNR